MRRIERNTAFKKDYKRESKGKYRNIIDDELQYLCCNLNQARYSETLLIF